MLIPTYTSQFGKDVKRQQKRGRALGKLKVVLGLLIEGTPLPIPYKDHPLKGALSGYRECHIEPDWLLIYKIQPPQIYFVRTGTHSDLFD